MPTNRELIADDDRFYLTAEGLCALLDTEAALASVRLSDGQETASTPDDQPAATA